MATASNGEQCTPHALAKAIRSNLSNGKSSLETSTLYSALSNPELMNGNGNLSESVWNELATMAVPESASYRPVSVSIEIYNGKVSQLKPQWKEIKTKSTSESAISNETMRRWPSLSPSLHVISTWYGYSLYVPVEAFSVLEMEKASTREDTKSRYTPSMEALSRLNGFPPGALNGLVSKLFKSVSELKLLAQKVEKGTTSVGVIISATWLAPHALCTRAWTSLEESLPSNLNAQTPATPPRSVKAFPSVQDEQGAPQIIYVPAHQRSNSVPFSPLSMNVQSPDTPPITPGSSDRKTRRSFFGLIRRPSTPSSPSISRNTSAKLAASQQPSRSQNIDENFLVNAVPSDAKAGSEPSANTPAGTEPTATEPSPADPTSGSSGGSGTAAPLEGSTSTSTSNAGTGVAVAIGPKSASAATATHGPTFAPDTDSTQGTSGQSSDSNPGNKEKTTQRINGAGNLQVLGSFSLLKFGFGGGSKRCREIEQRAAYDREQATKRQERLALILAATRVGVAGGGVAVAVPGSSASASFSAVASGDSTKAEAETGKTAVAPQISSEEADSNGHATSNSSTKAESGPTSIKKLHSSKGQIQTQFIKEDDEDEDEEEDEAEKPDISTKKMNGKHDENGRSITRTTVTTVTTTDVERIPAPNPSPDSLEMPQTPTVTVSAT